MKRKTSIPCPKQPKTRTYRELDKSTSRITPDFIMVELVLSFIYILVLRLVYYLLVFRLQMCVQISISSMSSALVILSPFICTTQKYLVWSSGSSFQR